MSRVDPSGANQADAEHPTDSPVTCLEELRGRSWAYNDPASHSGHTVTLYSLVRMGARPGFFARVVEAGFHQAAAVPEPNVGIRLPARAR